MDDRDIDRLLSGTPTGDDAANQQLAQVLRAVDEAYPQPSTEGSEAAHLAAMMETAHLFADSGEPACRPVYEAYGPGLRASRLPRVWRSTLSDIWAMKSAKVAAVTFAAVLALGGTAFAGGLPAPVQNVVATAAQGVGITLPSTNTLGTIVPGDRDHSSDETGTVGAGHDSDEPSGTLEAHHGLSSHEASDTIGHDNGRHLGWTNGNHFGWYKHMAGHDESGTVDPSLGMPKVKGHGPSLIKRAPETTPKSKGSHGGNAGHSASGIASPKHDDNGSGKGNGMSNGMGNGMGNGRH